MSASDLAIVAALVFAWGTLLARLERFDVTAPITFVLAGVLLTHGPLAPLGFQPSHETVKALAEITLVLVLFSDASRVGLRDLRSGIVMAHGATADPLARRYGPRVALATGGSGDLSDDLGAPPLPERRLIRRASPIRDAS